MQDGQSVRGLDFAPLRQADRMAAGIEHPDFHPGIRSFDLQFVPNRIGLEFDARCPSRLVVRACPSRETSPHAYKKPFSPRRFEQPKAK